jgi:hypothetical protein
MAKCIALIFATTYAIARSGQMSSSGHRVSHKAAFSIQALHHVINLIASWFAIVDW